MLDEIERKYNIRRFLDKFTIRIDPNIITTLALIVAIAAGYLFYIREPIFAGILVLLNGFLDILDGKIAKKYKLTSKKGDFLDHTFDRLADVAMFTGVAMSGLVPMALGFMTIIAILLVSYLGTQAHALTNKRLYSGFVGRADRIVILTFFSLLMLVYENALYYGIILIFILSGITFLQRFLLCYNTIKSSWFVFKLFDEWSSFTHP